MSLNGYLAVAALCLLPFSPLLVVAAPCIWWQRRRARELAQRDGYLQLDATMVRCLEACVEAMVRPDEGERAERAVRDMDRYLHLSFSSRTWRTKALILAVEHAPRLSFKPAFSAMSRDERRAFVDARLSTTKGIYGTLSLLRQLVRLGYYSSDEAAQSVGFVPLGERGAQRRNKPSPVLV